MENLIKRLNFILYTLVAAFVIVVILRVVFEGSSIIQGDGVMLLLDILKWIILVAGVMIGVASDYIRYKEDPSKWLSKFKIMIITICTQSEIIQAAVLLSLFLEMKYGIIMARATGIARSNKYGLSKLTLLIHIHHPIRRKNKCYQNKNNYNSYWPF